MCSFGFVTYARLPDGRMRVVVRNDSRRKIHLRMYASNDPTALAQLPAQQNVEDLLAAGTLPELSFYKRRHTSPAAMHAQ